MDESDFIISSYTVDDALEDGTLVSMTKILEEMGEKPFGIEALMTSAFFEKFVNPENCHLDTMQDLHGRLWDVVNVSRAELKRASNQSETTAQVLYIPADGQTKRPEIGEFKVVIGPRDENRPALFFMLPDED